MILVTGGCGYIGSQLIRDLAEEYPDQTIRILDNMMRERYVSLWDLPRKFEFIKGDTRNKEDVKKALKDVDCIFDLAGITNAPMSFKRKDLTMDTNVGGVKNILEFQDVDKYIYTSTASVYGPTPNKVTESFDCKPASPYGESKLLAEQEINKSIDNGLNASILRLGTIHGFSIGMRFDTVIDRFVFQSCRGESMTVWEVNKNEKRPYLHIRDATRALIHAINTKGTFNVVSQNTKLMEVVNTIKSMIPNSKVVFTQKENLNQLSYELSSEKFKKTGFKFNYTIQDGVVELMEKFKGLI